MDDDVDDDTSDDTAQDDTADDDSADDSMSDDDSADDSSDDVGGFGVQQEAEDFVLQFHEGDFYAALNEGFGDADAD